ncbi:ROK family protein [Emticicia sp. CRIBPO]|uniref:ROK family protein n=1 Tax=Emticicia sp. CRIBPO TaxID=2683258 RepID=UPI00141245E7|nr:ROK family protein [Emticicia sp. CRIBPO]NBA86960.1 ROK family protein [Emticicia sp. CRIBPO]
MKTAIGIDLGGTVVKGILIREGGEIMQQHYISTRDDQEGLWRKNVLEMVSYLRALTDEPVEVIGLSAPGLPDQDNACIAHLPNRLHGLENFNWGAYFGQKTYVINDAHAALMAEARFGSAKDYKNALLLTLGTGVGGGIMLNGELHQGLSQMAGHLGHISLNTGDDEESILGIPGSLEYAIGNYSIKRRSRGQYESTLDLVGAYRKGDHYATWLWLDSVRKLAVALSSLINLLSPEIIVLAGGITLADKDLYEPLMRFLDLYEFRPAGKTTLIRQAQFGDLAGAIGAAGFALNKIS